MFGQTQNVVCEMEFDEIGALLATVSRNGAIRVYDFDEFDLNMMAGSEESVQPVLDFWTFKDVDSLRWNPSNQAELTVSFRARSFVYVYNLETNRRRKIFLNGNKKHSGIGCECLEFVPKRSNVFVVTDIKGQTQLLDTRIGRKPQWSFLQPSTYRSVRSSSEHLIISLFSTHALEHRYNDVVFVCTSLVISCFVPRETKLRRMIFEDCMFRHSVRREFQKRSILSFWMVET
jgi:WD40 repeat protein